MTIPANLTYTAEHEWLLIDGDIATVGVTAYAADALGDVVYLDLPQLGATLTAGEACGEIESTKSVSDLFAPANGEVTEINKEAVDDPSLVNLEPFGRGWLFRMTITGTLEGLDSTAYQAVIGAE